MRTVALCLDGVLRKPLDTQAQDMGGALLYQALSNTFRVVVLGSLDRKRDEHFLMVNGFNSHVKLEEEHLEDAPSLAGRRRMQLTRLRAAGFTFEFVVVPDPDMAKQIYRSGTSTLLYLHPEYSSESFRPDYAGGIRPWSELEAEVEYQRDTKAAQTKNWETPV